MVRFGIAVAASRILLERLEEAGWSPLGLLEQLGLSPPELPQ